MQNVGEDALGRAGRRGRGSTRGQDGDAGVSLVEMLVTVVIVGLAFTALIGMVWTTIRVSVLEEETGQSQAVLRNYAETLRSTAVEYVPCASPDGGPNPYPPIDPIHDGFEARVVEVRFWDGLQSTDEGFLERPALAALDDNRARCTTGGDFDDEDYGVQALTLEVESPPGDGGQGRAADSVVIVKRDAACDDPDAPGCDT